MPAVDKLLLEEALQDSPQVPPARTEGPRCPAGPRGGRGNRCPIVVAPSQGAYDKSVSFQIVRGAEYVSTVHTDTAGTNDSTSPNECGGQNGKQRKTGSSAQPTQASLWHFLHW